MLIKQNKDEFQAYLEDTSNLKGDAALVYLPQTKEELISAIKECNNQKLPFTISAAKTGTTAGCVPLAGAVISIENLKKIIELDSKRKIVSLEAGVTFKELEGEIAKHKLALRASPTEPLACLAGAVSTSASGVRGFGYGSIRNYVERLEIILASGEALDIIRGNFLSQKRLFDFSYQGKKFKFNLPTYDLPKTKSQAGYFAKDNMDLIDLFIGSEGTLGVISACSLSLQDVPFWVFDGLTFFIKEEDAFSFVDKIKSLKASKELQPASLEFFDKNALDFLKSEYSFIPACSAAIYFEQEAEREGDCAFLLEKWAALIEESGALADKTLLGDNPKERERIFEIRHKLPQLINEFLRQHKQIKAASDIAVPWRHFKQMYDFYKEIALKSGIAYVNFGHIGESHLHFNFLPKNEGQTKKAKEYLALFCQRAVALGGTISAEHGIGKIKKPYLKIMYSEKHIREMAALKKYFDPQCLLGLDNIFEKELLFGIT